MKIITISGVDGSGKSTQVNKLTQFLRGCGSKVFYFHAVEFSLAKKLSDLKKHCLFCRVSGKCNTQGIDSRFRGNDSFEKSVTEANDFQIWLRKIFLRIDLWRFKRLREKLEKQGYDFLLSDRYFFDSIINIEYLSRNRFDLAIPQEARPGQAFYLEVAPEAIMGRERVPDQGMEYLREKQKLFLERIKDWNLLVIDENGSQEEVFQRIISNF